MTTVRDILKRAVARYQPLPPPARRDPSVPMRRRSPNLSPADRRQALANALRYFDCSVHAELAAVCRGIGYYGHIYVPLGTSYEMQAYPIEDYPAPLVKRRR